MSAFAQQPDDEVKTFAYHKFNYLALGLNTNGWHSYYRLGKHQTAKQRKHYEISLASLKHKKEVKQATSLANRSYVYGKENYVYRVQLGYGKHHTIAFKSNKDGVELKTVYTIGLSNAILKPVYYTIALFDDFVMVEELFDPQRHNPNNILGEASFFKGFNELSYIPGIYGKFALNYEFAEDRARIKALELGVTVDIYPKALPILSFETNSMMYYAFYISFQLGSKKYR